jgi:hypothetical protein
MNALQKRFLTRCSCHPWRELNRSGALRVGWRWILAGPRGAATRLGINCSTLQFRMKRLGIERPKLGE